MRVGFIGLGKLGLPCAVATSMQGHDVMGYDINPDNMNKTPRLYKETGPDGVEEFNPYLEESTIQFGSLQEVAEHSEIIFVAIQTPHSEKFEGITRLPDERVDFDYTWLKNGIESLAEVVKKDTVIAVISTVLPGTVRREIIPLLNNHMKLVYTPQFIAMGTTMKDFIGTEFWLFGVNDEWAAEVGVEFFKTISDAPIVKCTVEEAEAIKVFYNCYSDDTEVMTNEGWKFFADLSGNELILSLNPETHEAEWSVHFPVSPNSEYKELIHFHSSKDSILVTPGHNMYAASMCNKKDCDCSKELPCDGDTYHYKFKLISAEELMTERKTFSFTRSARWVGEDLDYVTICSREIPVELFIRFMSWYLAEGFVSQMSMQSWQISISQSKRANPQKQSEIKFTIEQICKIFDIDGYHETKFGTITFYHKQLGIYLSQFGTSFTKWVPKIIKEMSSPNIRSFLNTYANGDGTHYKDGRVAYYATCSKQMADDLSEMIIKVGNMPSFKTVESPISSKECFLVYETISNTSCRRNVERVPYNGLVWCTSLEKNHIMLTRHNGKCTWQGNTFISTKIALANTWMEMAHKLPNVNVDTITDTLALATRRVNSFAYMRGGQGDGGGSVRSLIPVRV